MSEEKKLSIEQMEDVERELNLSAEQRGLESDGIVELLEGKKYSVLRGELENIPAVALAERFS